MPTFEEIARWSVDDANAEILRLKPTDWKFELETLPTGWRVSYQNDRGVVIWADTHYDLRVLMLGAFGWLWQQKHPPTGHPAWRPQPSRPLSAVHPATQVPDPPDLDPAHIRSVYERRRKG